MAVDTHDTVSNRLASARSRRRSLGSLAALGAGAGLAIPVATSGKKKKRCPACPTCPTTPAPEFCTGKNDCAQTANVHCSTSNLACRCNIRADTSGPFCGIASALADTCSSCPEGSTCVVLGGLCGPGFGCATACPTPV
ncbi:MAG: hypothetical protein U0075_14660 [Thermomicrobiales bacterium]